MTTNEIYWLSGFLDGEGSFLHPTGNSISITACQKDPELLERVKSIMKGGNIYQYKVKGHTIHFFRLTKTRRAASWMMTLYPLMSSKRKEQIRNVLHLWKSRKAYNNRTDLML